MTRPLAIDLCCGLGGWTEGLLLEGYDVVGFDVERHQYGEQGGGAEGWFGSQQHPLRAHHSKHPARKRASALIAKIPLPLSRHIAATYKEPFA